MVGGLNTDGRIVRAWRRFLRVPRQNGFTVIEVIVVLAVTGGLFVAAAIMIAGRQNQTAFEQSSRQVQSQIQQAINEVSAGFYPTSNDFSCDAGPVPNLSSVTAGQGTNSGCIFLGKAMQFGSDNNDPDKFTIYTIAGLQKAGGAEVTTLEEAAPMVVAHSTLHDGPNYPDNTADEALYNGLRAVRMWYNDGGIDHEIGIVAFVNGLAQYTGDVISGSGNVNVVAVDGSSLGMSKIQAADLMNSDSGAAGNGIAGGTVNPPGGVFICFDGGTDDYAIVQVGGGGRELDVTLVTIDKEGDQCAYP